MPARPLARSPTHPLARSPARPPPPAPCPPRFPIPPSLPPPSLLPSLSPSLPPSLPPYVRPSVRPSLPPYLPPSLPPRLCTPLLCARQVSHAARSAALSKREKYPTFYRLAVADSAYNAPRTGLLRAFNWRSVAALHADTEDESLVSSPTAARTPRTIIKLSLSSRASYTLIKGKKNGNLTGIHPADVRPTDGEIRHVRPSVIV